MGKAAFHTLTVVGIVTSCGACATDTGESNAASAAAPDTTAAEAATAPAVGPEGTSATTEAPASSALQMSAPADQSTVQAPTELMLHFKMPVQLQEVTVEGPGGAMPMSVQPAGPSQHYTLPLSGLAAGAYKVTWRASAGQEYTGSFSFTVK